MTDLPSLTDTWNNGGTVFTAINMDVTNTASAAGSKLLDLLVGGVSKFKILATGEIVGSAFSNSAQGLVPASGGGTANFLRADGTWAVPLAISDGDKGDIVVSGSGAVWTIDNNVVSYAKMQDVSATARFLGRITSGAGDTEELTGTQATTLLDAFTSGLKGLAPASGGGAINFLRADGSWAAPPSLPDGDKGDITVSSSGAVWTIDNDVVTYAKMQNVSATSRFLGRITGGAGDTEELTGTQATTLLDAFTSSLKGLAPSSGGGTVNFLRADGSWATPPGVGGVPDGDKGDITVSSSGAVWTIDNDVVTYAKMQNVSATARFLGRITASAGDTEELSGTQATTLLDAFTSSLKGLAPASGGGTVNFLRADGSWAPPIGNVVGPGSATDNAIARFDTTTGKLLQNSTVIIGDDGSIIAPGHAGFGNATSLSTQYAGKIEETFSNAALQATFGGGLKASVSGHLTSGSTVGLIGASYAPALEVDGGLTATAVQGLTLSVASSGAGILHQVQGLIVESTSGANGNVGTYVAGGEFSIQHLGTGSNPLMLGLSVSTFQSSSAGLVTDVHGLSVRHTILNDAVSVYALFAGATGTGAGTSITNNYGLYIEAQNSIGATISDNIRSKGANSFNVFEGYVRTVARLVSALGSAATAGAGARSFVTDATATTYLSVVAGGSNNKVPVVSDGTNWLIG